MKKFTTPGVKETKEILLNMRVRKTKKSSGREHIEQIKANLGNVSK